MQFRHFFLTALWMVVFYSAVAQTGNSTITGTVTDTIGNAVQGATIAVTGTPLKVATNAGGTYRIAGLRGGKYTLTVSSIEYAAQRREVQVANNGSIEVNFSLSSRAHSVDEVNIQAQTGVAAVRQQAFAVDVVDVKKLAERDVDMNRLMDAVPGVRVQENGGLGSGYNYSIHGLSGKAVKFFVDGIPMESFGSTFSINNFPANVIDRVDVYKGVVPIELGSDALGGAINIVTRKNVRNYLDLSHSTGSYNTQRSAVSGKWRHAASGFTLQTNSFFNYSDNNYKVWGPTVEVAGPDGRPLPGNIRYRRFNDDYRAYTLRAEAGFTNVSWADQLMLGLTYADQHRGIQTGRTMAFVYGGVRYREDFLMPSLRFVKNDFIVRGLHADIFTSYNKLNGTTVDTGSYKYNWRGDVISSVANGELGGIRTQKSIYTFNDDTWLGRAYLAYTLKNDQVIKFNYTLNTTSRQGSDAIALAEWTIPFLQPQDMNKHIAGLSYEALLFNKWTNIVFVKHFAYNAKASVYEYNGGANRELFYRHTNDNSWGYGYAGKLALSNTLLLKFSAENTSRLPEAAELFGDGNTILNAPTLKPEKSFNMNASVHKTFGGDGRRLTLNLGAFYRNVNDLILLGEGDIFGTARYENVNKTRSTGAEAGFTYTRRWFEFTANGTYLDLRNRLRYLPSGATNIVYNDRLRNTPYLLANGEVRLNLDEPLHLKQKLSFYINTHYVHQYYLGWPSLGDKSTKAIIPSQFVQDAGLGYAFSESKYSINLACRNIFDKQVYDNYLLQKPGRFISVKLRCLIQ